MLSKHQIGFLARFWAEVAKTGPVLHLLFIIVLAKRRITDDIIEPHQFTIPFTMLGMEQRIPLLNLRTLNTMQDHIHPTDGPRGAIVVLSKQGQALRITTVLLYI